jgi:hypothetical protein
MAIGVPACGNATALAETSATGGAPGALAVSEAALKDIHDTFLGISLGYRDVLNAGHGKPVDRITVATGRTKLKLDTNDYNYAKYLPAGTLVGANVVVGGSTGAWTVASISATQVQTTKVNGGGTAGGSVATALKVDESIGRLAFDKAANDPYVWVETVSTILFGGVQPVATA